MPHPTIAGSMVHDPDGLYIEYTPIKQLLAEAENIHLFKERIKKLEAQVLELSGKKGKKK